MRTWEELTTSELWELAVGHGLVDPGTARDYRKSVLQGGNVLGRLHTLEVPRVRPQGTWVPWRERMPAPPEVPAEVREWIESGCP